MWACEQHAQPRNPFPNTICRPLAIVVSDPSYLGRCSGCVLSHTHFSTSLVSSYIHIYAVMHRLEICPPAIVVNVMCRVVISGCLLSVWHSFAHMHRHLCDTHTFASSYAQTWNLSIVVHLLLWLESWVGSFLPRLNLAADLFYARAYRRHLLATPISCIFLFFCPSISVVFSPCYARLLHLFFILLS